MSEVVIPGLSIERQLFNTDEVSAITEEFDSTLKVLGGISILSKFNYRETVAFSVLGDIYSLLGEATRSAIDKAEIPYHHTFHVNIYTGIEKAHSSFHSDNASSRIIYLNDGGVYDYAPNHTKSQEVGEDFESLDVNAGDYLTCSLMRLIHRGRNVQDTTRRGLVFINKPRIPFDN